MNLHRVSGAEAVETTLVVAGAATQIVEPAFAIERVIAAAPRNRVIADSTTEQHPHVTNRHTDRADDVITHTAIDREHGWHHPRQTADRDDVIAVAAVERDVRDAR